MAKKHCPKCTINFYIGRPFKAGCGDRSVCPDCGLAFNHGKRTTGIIRCWVGIDDDHKHLMDGEFVPMRKRV